MNSADEPFGSRSHEPPPDVWDEELAQDLLGLRILVGLRQFDAGGELIQQLQFSGIVSAVDRRTGITLMLEGKREGQEYTLPPDTRGLRRGEIGEYRLRSTGEVVSDPDYVCSFAIHKPKT